MTNLLLILTGVLLNAAAQLVLKKGMSQIGTIQVDINAILTMILKVSTNLYVWTGLLFYVISFIRCFCRLFLFWRINDFTKNWWNSYYLHWCIFVISFLIM